MANKFIIEGAAFNGDGTSPEQATVVGGVGAWNTITYFEGASPAYGAIDPGDTIFIRSKTAAGADITRTLTATITLGSANGTQSVPISWVWDNGAVWPGVDGVLTFNCPSSFVVVFRHHNNFLSATPHNIRVIEQNPAANSKRLVTFGGMQVLDGIFMDGSKAPTATNGIQCYGVTLDYRQATIKNLKAIVGTHGSPFFNPGQGCRLKIINPDLEFITPTEKDAIFGVVSGGGFIEVIGGRIHGIGANTDKALTTGSAGGHVRIIGTQYPQTMKMYPGKQVPQNSGFGFSATVFGADNGIGSGIGENWGDADSRNDGYYPTLNARIPNSLLSGWSWKIYPPNASRVIPGTLEFSKLFIEEAAQKTVNVELLIADSIESIVNKNNTYITVTYIDSETGLPSYVSSQQSAYNPSPLEPSSAGWSATTWGATQLVKKKLSVATPTSIKKDTAVVVTLWVEFSVDSELKIMFACPDVILT